MVGVVEEVMIMLMVYLLLRDVVLVFTSEVPELRAPSGTKIPLRSR